MTIGCWTTTLRTVTVTMLIVILAGCGQPSSQKPSADKSSGGPSASAKTVPEKATAEKTPAEPVTEEKAAENKAPEKPAAVLGEPLAVKVPLGLPPLPVPADNPMTVEKVALGRQLYFDPRVSKDGTVSCATCHDPKMGWAERTPTSSGINKQLGGRNAPTVINAAYATSQFWDGRAATLEEQATGPVENPIEMGHSMVSVVEQFNKIPGYREQFQKVFGTGVTKEGFAKAVAAFERTVLSGDSAYDRYQAGDKKALTEEQQQGLKLFEEHCTTCHAPPLFSNYRFMNAGIGMDKPKPDEGRKDVTHEESDLGKFRVPALRDVADTPPYFHDGSAATLEDAVAIMAAGGKDNPKLSPQMRVLREAKIGADDQKKIVAFLRGLTGKYPVIEPPKFPE